MGSDEREWNNGDLAYVRELAGSGEAELAQYNSGYWYYFGTEYYNRASEVEVIRRVVVSESE